MLVKSTPQFIRRLGALGDKLGKSNRVLVWEALSKAHPELEVHSKDLLESKRGKYAHVRIGRKKG